MKKIILMLGLLSNIAFAGGEAGNGGDVLVEKYNVSNNEQKIRSVVLLDFYEGKTLYQLENDFLKSGSRDVSKIYDFSNTNPKDWNAEISFNEIKMALSFLENGKDFFNEVIYNKIRNKLIEMKTDKRVVIFSGDGVLQNTDDQGELLLPAISELVQIAINHHPWHRWGKVPFIVRQDLWNVMPAFQAAMLLLHEAIFFVTTDAQQSPGIQTNVLRELVAHLAADRVDLISDLENKLRIHRKLNINVFKYDNHLMWVVDEKEDYHDSQKIYYYAYHMELNKSGGYFDDGKSCFKFEIQQDKQLQLLNTGVILPSGKYCRN
jgi:hypothetical protein